MRGSENDSEHNERDEEASVPQRILSGLLCGRI